MPNPPEATLDRLLSYGIGVAIAAAAVVGLAQLVNGLLLDERFYDLNAKLEGNMFTWASTVATFAAALGAALYAVVVRTRVRELLVLAAIFAFLSIDDLVRIHERLGEDVGTEKLGLSKNLADQFEIVIFAPLFVTAFLILWRFAREVPERAARLIRLGLGLLVTAVAIETVGVITRRWEEDGVIEWPNLVRIAIEESMEVSGWILIAASLVAILCFTMLGLSRAREPQPQAESVSRPE